MNFPPTFLDSIGGGEEEEEGHGDNRGSSSLAFSVKPIHLKLSGHFSVGGVVVLIQDMQQKVQSSSK